MFTEMFSEWRDKSLTKSLIWYIISISRFPRTPVQYINVGFYRDRLALKLGRGRGEGIRVYAFYRGEAAALSAKNT